jgi:hypothetical protein
MPEEKHTAAPWELRPHGVVYGGPERQYANGIARSQIAMATGADFMEPGEQQANAKLIAAAPEMLIALKVARRELHACQAVIHLRGGFDPAYVDDAQRALMGMDAAIAQATE